MQRVSAKYEKQNKKKKHEKSTKSFKVVDSRAPLQEFEEPTPQPTGTQVLIKVKAACREERVSRVVQKIPLNGHCALLSRHGYRSWKSPSAVGLADAGVLHRLVVPTLARRRITFAAGTRLDGTKEILS
jgi:hypothetical protein